MTAQLESMATAAGLDLLAYFLAMARAEGEAASRERRWRGQRRRAVRLKRPTIVDAATRAVGAAEARRAPRRSDVGACRRNDAAAQPIRRAP